jgi:hypothetical protein
MRHEKIASWVVYRMPIKGTPDGMRAVCEKKEWDAMELARPGHCTLIQADIANEGEAEKLARGTSGDRPPRNHKGRQILLAAEAIPVPVPVPTSVEA